MASFHPIETAPLSTLPLDPLEFFLVDSLTPTDTIVTTVERAAEDSVTVTDEISYILISLEQSVADSLTLTDTIEQYQIKTRSLDDTLTLSDSLATVREIVFIDDVDVHESLSYLHILTAVFGEAISISDLLTSTIFEPQSSQEAIDISDSITLTVVPYVNQSDTITITDLIVQRLLPGSAIVDTITIVDVPRLVILPALFVDDTVSVGEVVLTNFVLNKSFCECIDVYDVLPIVRDLSDTLTITDSIDKEYFSDTIVITEVLTTNFDLNICCETVTFPDKSNNDSIAITEGIALNRVIVRVIVDSVVPSDTVAYLP